MSDARKRRAEELRDFGTIRLGSFREGDKQIVVLAGTLYVATSHKVESELERIEATDARLIVTDLRQWTSSIQAAHASS